MQGRKPTHQAYIVEDRGDQQDPFWRSVAPGWAHQSGGGLDLFIPAGMALTGRIVIREVKDEADRPDSQRRDRSSRNEPSGRR
jgi:hypothetical protein